jgi:predicted TIM-barrel fold metal-dependent hydrolase
MQNSSIIDAHAMLGEEYPPALGCDELLRKMDEHGIEVAIARSMGAELTIDNRSGNDRVLNSSRRIRALVSANPWHGDWALDELQRCRDAGAVGLFLHPSRQGFLPIEPVVAPLLDFAAKVGWPVMFHTGAYIQSDVLAVAQLARSYPDTQFVLGCGGFADMWFEVPGIMAELGNLWLETSHTLGDGIRAVLKAAGPRRIIFGSGEPSNRYAAALNTLKHLELDRDTAALIFRDNARHLYSLS